MLSVLHVAEASGQDAALHREILDNGLEVIVAPAGDSPMVTIEVVLRAGAAAQSSEEDEGIPHILEHVLFRAYGGRSGRDFGSFAGELGAAYNGTTGQEAVTYYVTLPEERLDEALALVSDLVRTPRFATLHLTDELEVVRGELERAAGDPYHLLDLHADMTLWGEGYRQRNPIGNMLTIMGARHAPLQDFYGRYYGPDNAALIVAGSVEPTRVLAAARKHFARWERGRAVQRPPVLPSPLQRDTVFVLDENASDLTLLVRWAGPGVASDPGAVEAAELFAELVNLPTSGTQQRLVESGLFDAVDLTFERDSRAGTVSLLARTTPDRVLEGSRALRQEMEVLGRPWSLTEEDVARARKRREVRHALASESGEAVAHRLARAWARGELVEGLPVVGLDEVRAFASSWIGSRPRVTGFLVAPAAVEAHYDDLVGAVQFWRAP